MTDSEKSARPSGGVAGNNRPLLRRIVSPIMIVLGALVVAFSVLSILGTASYPIAPRIDEWLIAIAIGSLMIWTGCRLRK